MVAPRSLCASGHFTEAPGAASACSAQRLRCDRAMLKTVLVAVDGSRASEKAVLVTIDLTRSLGAAIRALMVVDSNLLQVPTEAARHTGPPGTPPWIGELRGRLEAHAARVLEDVSS